MMSLQQFRVLLAVRDHGSLTRAADALRYGVPTLTHHLRALEGHLQVSLVERDRTGTRLTALGQAFAAEIEPVLAQIDRAERLVAERREAGVVTLRVGTFASIGSRLLPRAIAELQDRSSVRVEVIEGEPTEIVDMLRRDEVHAGLIYDVSHDPFAAPDLRIDTLLREPYRIMVPRGSELAEQKTLDFVDLESVAWVCSRSDNEASDRALRRVCHAIGHEVRELMRTDDLMMIHGLVSEGLGCALSTETAVDTDFAVELRPAVQDLGERIVSFATRKRDVPPAAVWLGEILHRVAS